MSGIPDGMMAKITDLERQIGRARSFEVGPTAGEVFAEFMTLPHLRGFWPLGNISEALYTDVSGQGRHLTAGGPSYPTQVWRDNGMHYVEFNGSTAYLTRADEAGLDITGSLTLGGIFRLDRSASSQGILGKYNATGNQRSYLLVEQSTALQFYVSSNGTALTGLSSSVSYTGIGGAGSWAFMVGRYTPSTEVAIFVNGTWTRNTTSIPASIFNSTANFQAASYGGAANFLDGAACFLFLSATAVSDTIIDRLWQKSRPFFSL